ncbi:hypothetical protein EDF72_5106 [Delftia acidovorans]|uniref:hypothetical protein n=1 Tax=Delftia acidovorans TaxID=80866 RepID=UPI000FB52CB2|nr:hypothetical protein [Delftia acidovorans]ROQ90101.1 hypothetical protein EDF72_5106 [Delftia acidovorans]
MIEILQDGAAILESKSEHQAIYTCNVQSCTVHVFLGEKASLFIHDTGQLSANSIKNLIMKCGKLSRCFSVLNQNCLGTNGDYRRDYGSESLQSMIVKHENRRSTIRQKANISLRWDFKWVKMSDMIISTKGQVSPIPLNATLTPIPERETRLAILTLNNLFADTNAQNLKVDLQFIQQQFTPMPALIRSLDEMLKIANQKQAQGDNDFHKYLKAYQAAFN